MRSSSSSLFSVCLFLATMCLQGQAAPAPPAEGRTSTFILSKSEMLELGRIAKVINAAHCPSHRHLQPGNSLTPSPRSLLRTLSSEDESSSSPVEPEGRPRAFSTNGLERGSNIVASSHDSRMALAFQQHGLHAGEMDDDVNWYISHSPASSGLTLSVSSLSDTDAFIQILSSLQTKPSKQSAQKHLKTKESLLAPLPEILFPARLMEQYFPAGTERPMIHQALIQPLLKNGPSLVLSLMDLIQSPPVSSQDNNQHEIQRVKKLNVAGHGLGSNVALLVSLSVHLLLNDPVNVSIKSTNSREEVVRPVVSSSPHSSPPMEADDDATIFEKVVQQVGGKQANPWWKSKRGLPGGHSTTTAKVQPAPLDIEVQLFSMNRVGDLNFAKWVDQLMSEPTGAMVSTISISRVNSYADPIPHLPATWQGFSHFRGKEFWIDSDPRIVWSCAAGQPKMDDPSKEQAYEGGSCLDRVPMDKTSLLDHAGPFGGIWIGGDEC